MYTLDQGSRRPPASGEYDAAQLKLIEAATRVNEVLLRDSPQHYGAQLAGATDEEIAAAVAHDSDGIILRRMHGDLGVLWALDGRVRQAQGHPRAAGPRDH
jgi:hypothetical protein